MKGFTQVAVPTALLALKERDRRHEENKVVTDEAIRKFAQLKREAFLGKFRWGNRTDKEVARAYLPTFGGWEDILFSVATSEELEMIREYSWGSNYSAAYRLRQLADAADGEYLLLDSELAAFIVHYKPELGDE